MSLVDFFSTPLHDQQGTERGWLDLAQIHVSSGWLSLGDPFYFPNYRVTAEVLPGIYHVQATVRDYGTGRRIARLRACLPGSHIQSEVVGEIPVDFAIVGVCEHSAFAASYHDARQADPEFHGKFLRKFEGDFGIVAADGLGDAPMPFVRAGWGDGIYSVYSYVMPDGGNARLEAVFIEDDPDLFANVEPFQIFTTQELRDEAEQGGLPTEPFA